MVSILDTDFTGVFVFVSIDGAGVGSASMGSAVDVDTAVGDIVVFGASSDLFDSFTRVVSRPELFANICF